MGISQDNGREKCYFIISIIMMNSLTKVICCIFLDIVFCFRIVMKMNMKKKKKKRKES